MWLAVDVAPPELKRGRAAGRPRVRCARRGARRAGDLGPGLAEAMAYLTPTNSQGHLCAQRSTRERFVLWPTRPRLSSLNRVQLIGVKQKNCSLRVFAF